MPRYFFHLSDDEDAIDADGTELATLDSVKAQACRTFAELLRDKWPSLLESGQFAMVVKDRVGAVVHLVGDV